MAYTVPPGYAGTYGCYSMQPLYSIADPYTSRYHKNVALKIGTSEGEIRALRHFRTIKMSYVGPLLIRRMPDEFQVEGQNGAFHSRASPLAISVKAFRSLFPERVLPVYPSSSQISKREYTFMDERGNFRTSFEAV